MALQNAYLDIPTFRYLAIGANTVGLTEGESLTTILATAGTSSLTLASNQGFQPNSPVWILDGPNSEIVLTSSSPQGSNGVLNLSTPTLAQHGVGVSVSSAGARGCLAQIILQASGWIEGYCQQGTVSDRGFFQKSRTQLVKMPTTRAFLDPDYMLTWRPIWLPVQSISSMSFVFGNGVENAIDVSQVIFEENARTIYVPEVNPNGQQVLVKGWQLFQPPMRRGDPGFLKIIHISGFAPGSVPNDFLLACSWVVQELLAYAYNPTGAADIRQGSMAITQRLRGTGNRESSADSIFMTQAKTTLQPYRQQFV